MSRTILILSATPRDTAPLRVDEEVREIDDAIRRSQNRNEFQVITRLAVRARDVQRALLEHRPAIIHFSGHGQGEQGVVLEDDHGHPLLVGSEALANLFAVVTKWHAIECVLLNSCHSQAQIREMAQHVSYVIGMRQALDDRAGIAFARAFYEGLGNGASIPDAHDMACSTVSMSGLCADRVAVLASRTGTVRASDTGACELIDPAGSRSATTTHAFARDLPGSSGQRSVRRAARWSTMAATPSLSALLVYVLGLQVHRARELVIGTSGIAFSYDTAELFKTGMFACMGLVRSMATGLLVGLGIERWAVLILIAMYTVSMLLARSGKLRLCLGCGSFGTKGDVQGTSRRRGAGEEADGGAGRVQGGRPA